MKKLREALLIFPHQLFKKNSVLKKDQSVYLIEAPRYFTDFSFHKKKLVLHRASMQAYFDYLKKKKFSVTYVSFADYKHLFKNLKKENFSTIHYIDPVDIPFEDEFEKKVKNCTKTLFKHETPAFLSPIDWLKKVFAAKKKYFMQPFYVEQRKRLNILLTKEKKPTGGSWSYDDQNRKKIPKNIKIPPLRNLQKNKYVLEAITYVQKNFPNNPGSIENFNYPVTFNQAQTWFDAFLKNRFANFGPYEDAIVAHEHFLFHSVLSPLLNIGILTPNFVIKKALAFAEKNNIPLNSQEGFFRQIIGWREFVRAVYILDNKKQRSSNFFGHHKKIPQYFWNASTPIEPINTTIHKVLKTAYAHHIERLMILGNFMLLCEFKPTEVYKWFMELFIDAYDWVMVPNVYGMSQFCDGGLMTTKPYLSSSNYILKMSDYKKNEWALIWDALYWHFIAKNRQKLSSIQRIGIMLLQLKKMKKSTLKNHIKIARNFLKKI
jgi:deoxyribodipyrimidine photolyase-related protein